jgi:acyl dehydratase
VSTPVPVKERYFEDYRKGEVFEGGDYAITREEIVDFASRYDPQPFHLDEAAATASIYGGLIASGWMTCSVMMRILVDEFISPLSSMGSPGVDEVRWLKPVRPGDRLRARIEVLDARRSTSRPDRGVVRFRYEGLRQDGEVVLSMRGMGMYKCRTV